MKNWILTDKCRLISLLGIGGIGKTFLSIKVAQLVQDNFEFVIWRGLRNAPAPEKILVELIQFISKQKETNLPDGVLLPEIIQGLTSLQSRSLIEKQDSFFSQQTVIMEFMINNLIKEVTQEIKSKNLDLFNKVALIQAQTKDYIREAQIKAICQPIIHCLSNSFNTHQNPEKHLKEILQLAQEEIRLSQGYVAGNIINLLAQVNTDFTDYNFSNLTIKQANLQGINLHNVNFTNADLSQSVFTQTLGNILASVFSSDGKILATCDTDCQIRLWLVKTGKLLAVCSGHHNWVRAVAFSHDNKIVAN